MNWSNQFILQSGDLDSDYFPQPQNDLHQPSTITRDDLEPILYNGKIIKKKKKKTFIFMHDVRTSNK